MEVNFFLLDPCNFSLMYLRWFFFFFTELASSTIFSSNNSFSLLVPLPPFLQIIGNFLMLQHLLQSIMPGKLPVSRNAVGRERGRGRERSGGSWREEGREMVSGVLVLVSLAPWEKLQMSALLWLHCSVGATGEGGWSGEEAIKALNTVKALN